MKLNKLLALLVALLLAAMPALAEAAETAEEAPEATEAPKTYTVEAKTFPFYLQYSATMDPEQDEMKLYFVNGGDIPYVSLTEYMAFLSDILEDMDQGKVEFKVELVSDNIYSVSREDNKSAMLVSPEEDSLFFLNLNGLTQKVGSRAAVTIKDLPEGEPMDLETAAQMVMIFSSMVNGSIDMSEAAPDESTEDADAPADEDADAPAEETADEDAGADDEDLQPEGPSMYTMGGMGYYLNRQGDTVEFKLGDYMIDVIDVDGECYLPFQTMNDIFLAKMYLQFIFTGERVLGCGYEAPLAETRYSENPGTFSEDFAIFNYNELRFLLDTFYGLKHEHNINDFGTLMALDTNLIQDLAGTDPRRFDLALMQLAAMYLDDGHSGYIGGSVLAGVPNAKLDSYANYITFGPSTINRLRNRNKFDKARRAVYRAWVPGYEEVGDTAFITFDEFIKSRSDDGYYNPELTFEDPKDTVELIIYANQQIKREGSPIRNIVIDLSNNGGGDAAAAVFVLSWFLGDAPIALRDTVTGAQTNMVYNCDVDLDGVFNVQADTVSQGYNLYCMTSDRSFSCGNLLPAACKESGMVTMIGQPSGGGSCVVLPCTTASGALFQISGPSQLAIIKNGTFYNIDSGIEPDILLTKPESFYDRPALVEYLNASK